MESEMCFLCCSYYGNTDGMCSECYLERLERKEVLKSLCDFASYFRHIKNETTKKPKNDISHCWECNKKVGPVSFLCICEYSFCTKHRIPELHDCQYDFKTTGKRKLERENPKILADKFNKIV